jgi:membrane fusion protein (multidrug efflux system)
VPQSAVTLTRDGGTVYVIDGEGKAAMRPIKLGAMVDGKWIVESGLKPGDKVIVSNLQKIRPGAPVKVANTPTGRKPAAKSAASQPARTSGAE